MILLLLFILFFALYIIYKTCFCEKFKNTENLLVWGWGINKDRTTIEKLSKPFLESGKFCKLNCDLIGVGVDYAKWETDVINGDGSKAGRGLQRFYVLRDALKNVNPNQIIVVMDTADTILVGSEEEILSRFKKHNTKILISAEKGYTYQYPKYREKFDKNNTKTPYKYIAAGTFIGYADAIKQMVDDCINMCCKNEKSEVYNKVEMTVMSVWIHKHLIPNQPINEQALIKLDTNCDIFWVTTEDSNNYLKNLDNYKSSRRFYNQITNTYPLILHLVGGPTRDRLEEGLDKLKHLKLFGSRS